MKKIILLVLTILLNISVFAQQIQIESNTLAGTKQQLPFWLWANQLGRYDRTKEFIQNFAFNGEYSSNIGYSDFNFSVVSGIDIFLGKNNSIRFTELFGQLNWKSLQLKAGAFADAEKYNGLSASNGNLAITRNARPHPAIRIGFNRFVPITDGFAVYGFYEEGLLNDERYVSDTRLHHKAFYFKIGNSQTLSFTGGLEHFVMWGGTHPEHGKLPGWDTYFDYVLGKSGGENALVTDQINVLGNQFGTYQAKIEREWNKLSSTLYISHPFDDRSGLELENYQDNLYGVFIEIKRPQPLVKGFLVEYYYTKDQSGPFHLVSQDDGTNSGRGRDNYFNHGIYRSGATNEQFSMASPFFSPIIVEDGVSKGLESTRFSGFHLGADGWLSEEFQWKSMMSIMKHFGQYNSIGGNAYNPARKQFSYLFALKWVPSSFPLTVGASIAADHGSQFDNGNNQSRLGMMLSLKWPINQ